MKVPAIYRRRRPVFGETPLSIGLIVVLLGANMIHAAKIFDPFWGNASRVSYAVQGLIALLYIGVAIRRQHLEIAGVAIAIFAYLLFAHVVFVFNTHSHPNFNAIFTSMPLLSFVVFYESALTIRQILRIQLVVCIAYMLFYIAAYSTMLSIPGNVGVILLSHDGTGGRVYLSAAYAAFIALFAVRAGRYNLLFRGGMLAIAATAIAMSGTRTFLAILLLVLAFSAAGVMNRSVRLVLLVATSLAMLVILGGLMSTSWNPFLFLSSDASATYRASEYVVAVRAIQAHWLLGVGTPGDFNTLQAYLGTPKYEPLYPADLGIISPFFEFGLVGLIAFVGMTYFCLATTMISAEYEMQALQLTCMTCAIYGIASPAMLFEPSVIFVMMFVGAVLRQGGANLSLLMLRRQRWQPWSPSGSGS